MNSRPNSKPYAPGRLHPVDVTALRHLGFPLQHLTADSRQVLPGMTFAAFPGVHTDGRCFIAQAIDRGAASVLWEQENFHWEQGWHVPNQGIAGLRSQISSIAGQVYGNPSHHVWVVGITGTNGKTSCSHWLAQLMQACGKPCAVVGTLGNGWPGRLEATEHTTPDAIAVQALLEQFRQQGAWGCAMEVSSHGLEQERVAGVRFRGAVFTNLSQDHLDYHGNMAAYGAAKTLLFQAEGLEFAVINLDDDFGLTLARQTVNRGVRVVGYSIGSARAPEGALMLRAEKLVPGAAGTHFIVNGHWGQAQVSVSVAGRFNVSNLLAVMGAALMGGLSFPQVCAGIARLQAPPGRLEHLGGGSRPHVVIDYAHTPDALEKVLLALRETVPSGHALICVFGCGGNRDKGKRPLMGAIAERYADHVVLTSDNPRNESPEHILDQIASGMSRPFVRIVDRREAIFQAISQAQPGDVVLIAGKGHEASQEAAGQKLPFSDREEATRALSGVFP